MGVVVADDGINRRGADCPRRLERLRPPNDGPPLIVEQVPVRT